MVPIGLGGPLHVIVEPLEHGAFGQLATCGCGSLGRSDAVLIDDRRTRFSVIANNLIWVKRQARGVTESTETSALGPMMAQVPQARVGFGTLGAWFGTSADNCDRGQTARCSRVER